MGFINQQTSLGGTILHGPHSFPQQKRLPNFHRKPREESALRREARLLLLQPPAEHCELLRQPWESMKTLVDRWEIPGLVNIRFELLKPWPMAQSK
jgi:hypothetical protein